MVLVRIARVPPARGQFALLPEAVADQRQLLLDPSERSRQQIAEHARRLRGVQSVPPQPALSTVRRQERPFLPETDEPEQPTLLSAESAERTLPADPARFREYVEAQRSLRDGRDGVTRDVEIRVLAYGTPAEPSFGIEYRTGGLYGQWRSATPREGRFSSEPAAIADAVQKLWRQYRAEPIENPRRGLGRARGVFFQGDSPMRSHPRLRRDSRGRFLPRGSSRGRRRSTRRNPSELDMLLDNPRRRKRSSRRRRYDLLLDNPRRRRRSRGRRRSYAFDSLLLSNPRRRKKSRSRRRGYSRALLSNPRRRMPPRSRSTGRFLRRR